MKKFNGFESQEEYDFIANAVNEVAFSYPSVHTTWVGLEKGTIRVLVNDVKIEFDDFDKVKLMFADWKDRIEKVLLKRVSEICDKEFK